MIPDDSAVLESWTLNLYGIDNEDEAIPDFIKRGGAKSGNFFSGFLTWITVKKTIF